MKILKLRFKNINSFYGKPFTLDFTSRPLSEAGLFIISGPTGAGKSTILDVITLALFNEVPRFEKGISNTEIERLGSVVNKKAADEPDCEAYAEVEYEVRSGAYRSTWSISKNRRGNWSNYQMEIARLPGETLLDVKMLKDFPKKNAELIGLNYKQFIKSIILAQGSFAEFLKADRHTRSRLLEDITGTHIYRRLGEASYEKYKESGNQIKLKEAELKGITLRSSEEIEVLKENIDKKKHQRETLEKEITAWEKEESLASAIHELDKTLESLRVQKEALDIENTAFENNRGRISGHESVGRFIGPLTEFRELEKQNQRIKSEKEAKLRQSEKNQSEREKILEEAAQLTSENIFPENFVSEVNRFEKDILSIEAKIQEQRAQAVPVSGSLKNDLTIIRTYWIPVLSQSDFRHNLEVIQERKIRKEAGIIDFPVDLDVHERRKKLTMEFEALTGIRLMFQERENLALEGKKRKSELAEITDFLQKSEPEQVVLQAENLRIKALIDSKNEQLLKEITRQTLETHRAGLTEGEPCPLCGSLSHPYATHFVSQLALLGKEIEKLKAGQEQSLKSEKELSLRIETARKSKADLTNRLSELRNSYKGQDRLLREALTDAEIPETSNIENIITKIARIKEDREALETFVKTREELVVLNRLLESYQFLLSTKEKIESLFETKKKKYHGENIQAEVKALLSRWDHLHASGIEISRELTILAERESGNSRTLGEHNARIKSDLEQAGILSIEEAFQRLIPEKEYVQLKEAEKNLLEKTQSLNVRHIDASRTIAEKKAHRSLPDTPLADLRAQILTSKTAFRQLVGELGGLQQILETETTNKSRYENLLAKLAEKRQEHRKWELLKKYIGDATGNTFSGFAQSLTMNNLVGLANARLAQLSDRYLLDKPMSDTESLNIIDLYQGSQTRSVSTLSGGETFTVSLALALALSDLASRNVRIESLFIDEGFGTLDTETLESAVTILEKLQYESSKTVGVISHRQEMKERIPVQIQVNKGVDGTSEIKITG